MIELVIQSGRHQGKRLTLPPGEVVVGRDEDCQIRLTSTDISRKHCVLVVDERGLLVRDLESRNGTFINDVQVHGEEFLKAGDVLRIGPMLLQVPMAKVSVPREAPAAAVSAAPRKAGSAAPAGNRRAKATEDDIAHWLAEDDEGAAAGDTTIVTGRALKKTQPPPLAAEARIEKKKVRSVQEEAADIIRRHWEAKGRSPAPE